MAGDTRHFRIVEGADANLVIGSEKTKRRAQASKVFRSRGTGAKQAEGEQHKKQSGHDVLQFLAKRYDLPGKRIEIKLIPPHIREMSPLVLQRDLFDAAPPGLARAEAIVTPAEERALIAGIDAAPLAPFRYHGWEGRRLTMSYGWRYDFDNASFRPTEPIPDWLLPLRERAARVVGLEPDALVQSLLIRYDPGAGIGWHRDRPVFDHVLGLSLGAPAVMRFRRRRPDGFASGFDRVSVPLTPRSLYHLTGEARHQWEHSIAAMAATRWSITFRSLSEKGRRRAN
jgi:DNA oxidative demethylase